MKKLLLTAAGAFVLGGPANAQWTSVTSGTTQKIDCIYFKDDQNGFCSGGFVNILKTTNGGTSWTTTASPGMRDFSFVDDTYAYGASIVGQSMAKTTNGGTSWTQITPPTSNSLWAVAATSSSTAYFVGTGGVLWKTTTSGATVSVLSSGATGLLTDIVFVNATTGFIVVQTGDIRKTTNSGSSWNVVHTVTGSLLTEMYFTDANTGYVVGSNGVISKTTNGGTSWTTLTTGSTSYLQGINFYDANHGIAVGSGGTILYTSDAGVTWTAQTSGSTEMLYDVFLTSPTSAVVVGDNGTILINDNISTVGLADETELSFDATINPALQTIQFQTPLAINDLTLYDMAGNQICTWGSYLPGNYSCTLPEMETGVYIICANTPTNRYTKKVFYSAF